MSSAEHQGISVDVDHNPYLGEGSGTVDAIVSITADVAATTSAPDRVEAIIIDCSTSMTGLRSPRSRLVHASISKRI